MTGNGKHLCRGEQPGSMLEEALGGLGVKRLLKEEGEARERYKATTSSPFAAEKWRSKEISYSNVLVAP